LTDEEFAAGPQSWACLLDPFDDWQVLGHEDRLF